GQAAIDVAADVLEDVHPPALHDEERIARVVFVEQLFAADEDALFARAQHHVGVLGSELGEQPPFVELAVVCHHATFSSLHGPLNPERVRRSPNSFFAMERSYASCGSTTPPFTSSIIESLMVTMPSALPTCIAEGI